MALPDLSSVNNEVIILVVFSFFAGVLYFTVKSIQRRSGEQLAEYIIRVFYYLLSTPKRIRNRYDTWKIVKTLEKQMSILSDPDERNRRIAKREINQILSIPVNIEAAVVWKVDRYLIKHLSNGFEDSRIIAITSLKKIIENSDYGQSASLELMKALIWNLSEFSPIRDQSKQMLYLILQRCSIKIFIESIDVEIEDTSISLGIIDSLRVVIEGSGHDYDTLLKIFSVLNEYLQSSDVSIKKRALQVLHITANIQNADIIGDSGIIPTLVELLPDNANETGIPDLVHHALFAIGQFSLLPKIILCSRSSSQNLPKRRLSCIIYDTISSNNFSQLMEIDVLREIFIYSSERDIQTRICATNSIIRVLYLCRDSRQKEELFHKLNDHDIKHHVIGLLSDENRDVVFCGLHLLTELIRLYGKNRIVDDEILNSLFRCCLHDVDDVRYKAFQIIERLDVPIEVIINSFCRLGLDATLQDRVAERLAAMIQHDRENTPIRVLISNFEIGISGDNRDVFTQLKTKIENNLRV